VNLRTVRSVHFRTVLTFLICDTFKMSKQQTDVTCPADSALGTILAELREQGLTVRLHSGPNNTWHIADGGLYSGYTASGDELAALRTANKLNIRGIKDLG
jgi:hypothetical protein